MFDLATYLTFLLACVAVVIVPGPTVTVIIANSLRHGSRAGLANVAGTQLGLAVMLVILATGLQLVIEAMGTLFVYVKLIGAAYLIYLGYNMIRNRNKHEDTEIAATRDAASFRWQKYFWQGVLVIWSNPKALLFFGAFIPQFVVPGGAVITQTLLLGGTFMLVATVLDSAYAIAAGKAGGLLTAKRRGILDVIGGTALFGGGIWLALTKRAT
ncbi:MAG: transporter [Alphaproteobacteria bacterium]|nr:transporter [Alphaproteobacteria bacterium]MAS47286.1 transporter [Alphaproteobacteria bacterium]MAX95379.1 transporter [Alphaproteobacteria bacterium]MBN53167.1 transporter [Alphaproteobacteria bacterium]OUT41200.1 MAG: transporter [Micavibrio sp. TMED2]|tara:strand:- start:6671 stop:7309 length:639 start_codon:yes stop_codon:yes gene_type:complete